MGAAERWQRSRDPELLETIPTPLLPAGNRPGRACSRSWPERSEPRPRALCVCSVSGDLASPRALLSLLSLSLYRSFCRLFSSLGELSTISQRSSGTTYTVRPGSRYPVTRRTPSPVKPALDRTEPLSTVRPYGLTPPTILKSSSLSIPHEPKEVRFVVRSVSARSRSPSPSPSPGPPLHTLHPPRPFMQKPLHLWNKYDVGDWLESINLVEHRDKFEDHEIEGTHLPALTKEDFVELGVTRVGHRMNIERALKQLVDS